MTSTRKLTFADYLALDNSGLERRAELIDGVLTDPNSGTGRVMHLVLSH
ncbi:hypothetical protein [Leptodesmis sp.]